MDYMKQPLQFKLQKAIRFCQIYGVRRTLVKIKSYFHMAKLYDELPRNEVRESEKKHVGLLGCGKFGFAVVAYYLNKEYGKVMRRCMDADINKAASLYEHYKLLGYSDKVKDVLDDPDIDLVYIASNHASHAEYAIMALEQGKNVHIEKPHVVTYDQLSRLCEAMQKSVGKVTLGFNRPKSKIGRQIKKFLDDENGPAMFNWFIAGHELPPDDWYFKEEEGGRVLGNLCHWTDFVLQMVPTEMRYPLIIHPIKAGKSDCDVAVNYVFGDGTIAVITFSAKGHTFEGVREQFAGHKGNTLINMVDFQQMTVDVIEKKYKTRLFFRDHGHQENICFSYEMNKRKSPSFVGCEISYVWETGNLFLKTKEALEINDSITIDGIPGHILNYETNPSKSQNR